MYSNIRIYDPEINLVDQIRFPVEVAVEFNSHPALHSYSAEVYIRSQGGAFIS